MGGGVTVRRAVLLLPGELMQLFLFMLASIEQRCASAVLLAGFIGLPGKYQLPLLESVRTRLFFRFYH